MTFAIDVTGQRFGQLVAVKRVPYPTHAAWRCRCDCGNECVAVGSALRRGTQVSCGCFKAARLGIESTTHGLSKTREYAIWGGMINRCTCDTNAAYDRYGGRGITVCDRWKKFENFLADMGPRPSPAHSLDRIDNDGGYEPGNVRWTTAAKQSINRRSNVMVMFRGKEMPLKHAAAEAGLPYQTVHARVKHGWSADRALTEPVADRGQTR